MRYVKTWAVAAGAAAVLGGLGVGVAQAAGTTSAPAATVAPVAANSSRQQPRG